MQILKLLAIIATLANSTNYVEKTSIVLKAGSDSVTLPVVPADLPEIELPQGNENFDGILGDISLIGTMGLRKLKISSLLPAEASRYNWCYPNSDDAADVINFINKHRMAYDPFRITITRGSVCYLNMQCLINDFTYHCDNVGDYHYTMDIIEYRVRDSKSGGLTS